MTGPLTLPLARVARIELDSFRGWGTISREGTDGAAHSIDTDGDIVLIVGANGTGKTSLLQALLLLLSNVDIQGHVYSTGASPRESGDAGRVNDAALAHQEAKRWSLRAYRNSNSEDEAEVVQRDWSETGESTWTGPYAEYARRQFDSLKPLLRARALSVFQEFLPAQFEGGFELLAEFLSPMRPSVNKLLDKAEDAAASLEDTAARTELEQKDLLRTQSSNEADGRKCVDELVNLLRAGAFEELRNPAADALTRAFSKPWHEQRVDEAARRAADELASLQPPQTRGLGRNLSPVERLKNQCSHLLAHDPDERERLLSKQGALSTELRSAPAHKDDFTYELEGEPFTLAKVLKQLGIVLDRELSAQRDVELAGVAGNDAQHAVLRGQIRAEFKRIHREKLVTLIEAAEVLGSTERRTKAEVQQELDEVKKELETLNRAIGSKLDDVFERLHKAASGYEEARRNAATQPDPAKLRERAQLARRLAEHIPLADTQRRIDLERYFNEVLDRTLFRFQPREGFLPVRWKLTKESGGETRALVTADDRPWTDASTGQKGQLALASALGHALVLRPLLPAHILLLDDTSTSFDLGNLVRQASWVRQLAYTDDDTQRYQLFIASHHDELTSRLVDLLVPPPGRSLVVLEFTDYKPGFGPVVERREMRSPFAVPSDASETTERLARRQTDAGSGAATEMARALEEKLEQVWDVLNDKETA